MRLESENTEVGLSEDDLFEEVERPELAQGSDAGTYDDLEPDIEEVVDEAVEEVVEAAPKPSRFTDADTVVSVTTFPSRKG